MQGDEAMMQGLIAGWIFILFMVALFADESLRHAIPASLGVLLAAVVVTMLIWTPIILDNKNKRKKTKKQVIEIEVLE